MTTALGATALAMTTMAFMSTTAMADCAGMTAANPMTMAADVSTMLPQTVVLASSVGDTWVGSEDGAIMAMNDEMRPADGEDFNPGVLINNGAVILATETSQQLPAGVGDPLFVTEAALTDLPVPDAADQTTIDLLAALTTADTPWTAMGSNGASSS